MEKNASAILLETNKRFGKHPLAAAGRTLKL